MVNLDIEGPSKLQTKWDPSIRDLCLPMSLPHYTITQHNSSLFLEWVFFLILFEFHSNHFETTATKHPRIRYNLNGRREWLKVFSFFFGGGEEKLTAWESFEMASSYRNGYRGSSSGSMKVDRPVPSSNLKAPSFKSRTSTGSVLRRSSPASLTALDDGGQFGSVYFLSIVPIVYCSIIRNCICIFMWMRFGDFF